MKICWVVSEETPSGFLDPQTLKSTAPTWGSWKNWKEYKLENCICSSTADAKNLITRAFHAVCNLYIMQASYIKLGSPIGVRLFNGTFKNDLIANKDDIITLNLVAGNNDIVLMSGFNFSPLLQTEHKIKLLSREEYYYNIRELMKTHFSTQFVLVDYVHELASWAKDLDNLSLDNIDNVKLLLG